MYLNNGGINDTFSTISDTMFGTTKLNTQCLTMKLKHIKICITPKSHSNATHKKELLFSVTKGSNNNGLFVHYNHTEN